MSLGVTGLALGSIVWDFDCFKVCMIGYVSVLTVDTFCFDCEIFLLLLFTSASFYGDFLTA